MELDQRYEGADEYGGIQELYALLQEYSGPYSLLTYEEDERLHGVLDVSPLDGVTEPPCLISPHPLLLRRPRRPAPPADGAPKRRLPPPPHLPPTAVR